MEKSQVENDVIDLNDPLLDQEGETFLNNDFLSKIRNEIYLRVDQNPKNKKQIIKNFNRKKNYFKCDLRDDDSDANFEYFEKSTSEEEEDIIIETKIKKKKKIRPRRRIVHQKKQTLDLQSDQEDIQSIDNNLFIDVQQEKSNFVNHLNYIFTKDKSNFDKSDNQFTYQYIHQQ